MNSGTLDEVLQH